MVLEEEGALQTTLLTPSVHSLRGCVGSGRAGGVYVDEGEFLFVGEGGVYERLDAVAAGRGELDVEEEAYVVGDAAGRDIEGRGLREHDGVAAVGRHYADFGEVRALAAPLRDDGEFHERHGEALHRDLVEDSHQRELVAHLKANVVAEERVDELKFVVAAALCHFHFSKPPVRAAASRGSSLCTLRRSGA